MFNDAQGHSTLKLWAIAAAVGLAPFAAAADVDIDAIMDRMTLEQKLGQLTIMPTGEPLHNPPAERSKMVDGWRGEIRAGILGSVFGPNGARYANELQRAAVEESDHKIPVLIANDIIHGYRTIFPIPLASSGSFNIELLESLTRAAAVEAQGSIETSWASTATRAPPEVSSRAATMLACRCSAAAVPRPIPASRSGFPSENRRAAATAAAAQVARIGLRVRMAGNGLVVRVGPPPHDEGHAKEVGAGGMRRPQELRFQCGGSHRETATVS